MLPYWHGASIEFCVRPPPHQRQQQQQQQRLKTLSSTAVVASAWQSVSDDFTYNAGFDDYATCPAEAAAAPATNAAAAAAAWNWLDEDRLHSAISASSSMTDERRELDSRAAVTEEQLLAQRIARIAAFDNFGLSSRTNWRRDSMRDLGQKSAVHPTSEACSPQGFERNRVLQDPWLLDDNDDMASDRRQKRHSPQSPPHQANNSNRTAAAAAAAVEAAAAAVEAVATASSNALISDSSNSDGGGQAVASGRSLADIEASMELTRNNSNQKQRYEMRGGHTVEICSRVQFPDRATRDVAVTVEATHSNGCHRVIMFKGLTAKKRPDLGPKVKDCRLRMDQLVMTRASIASEDWQKSITMSYDSDFQVGLGEDKNRPL